METETLERLAEEYYEHIVKPEDAKQKPQFALAIIGVVGAGKTTVLRKICKQLPMVRVSGDEFRAYTHKEGLAEPSGETIAATNQRVVQRLRKQSYRIAYDNDFANPVIRADMLADNRRAGIPVFWVKITAPENHIINKLRGHEPTYLFKSADEAVARYFARKVLHETEADALAALPYIYTFDTSAADLDEQVTEAVRKIHTVLQESSQV